ncbi:MULTISPECIES: hypothetical protein [Moorena]|uniref:Uncharacterized protein n=1 Tax=Moorena producens 3L TaxID=489825 RepID=F4XZG7_9CYAN|nr:MULTISPECIES: hypothetical protein [Moorena]NEQ17013.1 hypothetical protein [Moorena sp. SIO3E2]EGJ29972.1 hypothetical protein LYNGBM3L_57500 [Moorena producens 3L]NEP33286.1 hypothetical protein [Moorena sp. SIO3B2]NEP66880.1 hypothetical protein [Moorena sp. SIO3A5]NEQ06000.1 hypothetical protein [Moorena sp. SIO4E2]
MRNQFGKSLFISALTALGVAVGATSAFAQEAPETEQEFEFHGTVEGTCSFLNVQPGNLANPFPEVLVANDVEGDPATGVMVCNSGAIVSLGDLMPMNRLSEELLDTANNYEYGVTFFDLGGGPVGEIGRSKEGPALPPQSLPPNQYDVEANMEIEGLLPLKGGDYAYKFTVTATAD